MAHGTTSSSKRKGGKVKKPGGLGGPGGRGGRHGSIGALERDSARGIHDDLFRLKARDLAAAVKEAAEREPSATGTPYWRAMSAIAAYANRESKTMKPELRKKLADAKRELRAMFGRPQTTYGSGGPGTRRQKPKVRSRRNPRV